VRYLPLAVLVLLAGCENEREKEAKRAALAAAEAIADGRKALDRRDLEGAGRAFKAAISATPKDVGLYLLLADTYRRSGNDTGAVLTLKQASSEVGSNATIDRALADVYLSLHRNEEAAKQLLALHGDQLLPDDDVLRLVRLLGRMGRLDEAKRVLGSIRSRVPDEAAVHDAELMRLAGSEVEAAKAIDSLLQKSPELLRARLWRVQYFLGEGKADLALKDVEMVSEANAQRAEVLELRAAALHRLNRFDEAAGFLEQAVAADPLNAESMALLAETKLLQGDAAGAQQWVDKTFGVVRSSPRAFYVRGRALELQHKPQLALDDYRAAIQADPLFAPALSRLWRLEREGGRINEALSALDRLFVANTLQPDDKLGWAQMLVEIGEYGRARQLAIEGLHLRPDDKAWQHILRSLAKKGVGRPSGVQIIK
jgi:tetratricopeptide (TPR) repeat protein